MQSQIKNTYEEYFSLIDDFFGGVKHYLGKNPYSHIDLGYFISDYPLISDLMFDSLIDLEETIETYWQKNIKALYKNVHDEDTLKCIYSGSISPNSLENFIKKSGLYIDSVIITDPILTLSRIKNNSGIEKKRFLNDMIRHVFNVWKMKDLLLNNFETNPIYILPVNLEIIESVEREKLLKDAELKFIEYANILFNLDCKTKDEVYNLVSQYKTTKELYASIKASKILPYAIRSEEKFNSFFAEFHEEKLINSSDSIGCYFCFYIHAQFIRVKEHKYFCNSLKAEPIYDYDIPWAFFNYEVGGMHIDAAISNSLQKENFNWINNLPIDAINLLRKENDLEYMRTILRKGLIDLKTINDDNLIQTAEVIEQNLQDAFKRQESEINSIQSKLSKYLKKDFLIATGGALAGFIPLLGNAISLLFAGRDIKNIFTERRNEQNKLQKIESNFISLLVKSYARK
jgi:hypothetical protein